MDDYSVGNKWYERGWFMTLMALSCSPSCFACHSFLKTKIKSILQSSLYYYFDCFHWMVDVYALVKVIHCYFHNDCSSQKNHD